MQKISPFLWFDNQAQEAANFYVSVFKNSKILGDAAYEGREVTEVSGKPEGSVMVVDFELDGVHFTALNGGPQFKFNESISFVVDCLDQAEVDYFWEKLTSGGGEESMCGWLKDKFGVSWQIVPRALGEMLGDPDKEKAGRAMKAMLQMKKIDIEGLKKAYEGKQY